MANDPTIRRLDTYGVYLAGATLVFLIGWWICQLLLGVFTNETPVYPMDTEDARRFQVESGTVLTQRFRTSHQELEAVEFMIDTASVATSSGTLQVVVGTDETAAGAELSADEMRISPLIRVETAASFAAGTRMKLQLSWSGENPLGLYIQKNPTLKKPGFEGSLTVHGTLQPGSILFKPVYSGIGQVVVGDVVDPGYEFFRMLAVLFAGRPVWVQWAGLLSWGLLYILIAPFVYITWLLLTDGQAAREKRKIAVWLITGFIVMLLLV